jgi:hypothetical protein
VTPAHVSRERRWRVVALVVLVVGGVAVAVGLQGSPAPVAAAPTPSALVGAPDAESTAWYCTGQSTAGGVAPGSLVLTNTTARAVTAAVTAVTDTGATAHTEVAVPAQGALAPAIPALSSGTWVSESVVTAGGGVAVTQSVFSPLGWSQAPCQSTASPEWSFASGTTAAADAVYLSLLNPTSTPVVVDLSFATPSGVVHPINYQGIVLAPGQVAAENVSAEVQQVANFSTIVAARTGRVVASEIQEIVGPAGSGGLSLVPGVAAPQSHWSIPQAQEAGGASSQIPVFNPGSTSETVHVGIRLPSGALSPLTDKVLPGTTWVLDTSAQTRIPDGQTYAAVIDATGGPGVVVSRSVGLSASATPPPQSGTVVAVDGLSAGVPTREWVVPPPGTSADPAVIGAAPASLALLNTSSGTETYVAVAITATGDHTIATGKLAGGTSFVVSGSPLAAAGMAPIVVHASGPMALSEDVSPSAGLGVVSMPGIPLSAAIGV